ncbi:MAG: substrate-binding domain-containing protein, partial [Aristaeellaceae bacterium]
SCATPSRRTETQQLINYLCNCGKRKIALVGFGARSINDNFRYHAAMSAIAARGLMLREKDVWLWEQDPMDSFRNFIGVAGEYDAVVCPNDVIAVYLVEYLRGQGVSVPEDLFVASFGNMAIGRYHRPSITSMTMDMHYVGEQAFSVWRYLMRSEQSLQRIALKITVPSTILIRESTACTPLQAGIGDVFPQRQDNFYHHPAISRLIRLEKCISRRDDMDMRILRLLMAKKGYEEISDALFISSSTLRYRLNKIYADAGVKGRADFELLVRESLGGGNPFDHPFEETE